jgi:hypothetical protein
MTRSRRSRLTRQANTHDASRLRRTLILTAAIGASALALLTPCAQAAGSAPGVHTGGAEKISFGSASLTGQVQPHASNTTYYFQYGTTTAYGLQTAVADVPANVTEQNVSALIGGLQPVTKYHYRLIAVNGVAAAIGGDRTFTTAKVPLSLQILAAPNPVQFGGAITVQGTLSGTENAGRAVVLQSNPFPYTAGFSNVGNPELTSATGGFTFSVLDLLQATQFRVVTTTKTPVVSPIALEGVAVQVTAHVAHARGRHRVRIFGTVSPAVNGMEVGIMRVAGGRNVLVAGTILRSRDATSSRFSRVLRVRHGLYRVLIRVTNGSLTSNYSRPLLIR